MAVAAVAAACMALVGCSASQAASPAPAAGTQAPPSAKVSSSTPMTEAQAEHVGTDAYSYGIPLMEFLRIEREETSVTVPASAADAPVNQIGDSRALANPSDQSVVQPNNDTLYTIGHLDLSAGPLVLHVPAIADDRYFAFEFIDPYTNVFAYVGTRTTGDGGGNFVITGPNFHGSLPHGLRPVRSPYNRAWMLGRTAVDGPGDLPAVHKIQDGYKLIPLADYVTDGLSWTPPQPSQIITTPTSYTEPTGVAFFDALGTALAQNPPPPRDKAILSELRTVGIGPGLQPSKENLSTAVLDGLAKAADNGPQTVSKRGKSIVAQSALVNNGWDVPPPNIGNYGTDCTLRAVTALFGIGANRPAEAMYINSVTDQNHSPLNGSSDYVIHFPAGQLPPAKYFWSLTMYNQQFFLVSNPINRYEISSHTTGLEYNHDGSLDIYIQHTAPAGHDSNWLPAPTGTFELTFRLYRPLPVALERHYVYPVIMKAS